ncbi:MAG TPA: alpha/beta hydrolase [Steroidobacteraceae bacterium]
MSEMPVTLRALGREAQYRSVRVCTPDGVSLAAQDWRQASSGRDVLLIHGFSQSHLSWLKQVSGPLAAELRLVSYDIRGHGGSDKPLQPHYYREPERWADEVAAVIRQAGLQRPALVFWSYAGRIALDYLSSRGDSEISALVFVNATSKADSSVLGPSTPLLRAMTQDELAANIDATLALLKVSTARPLADEELRYMLAFNMVVPPTVRANLVGRVADYEATLRSLHVPVLALHGDKDTINLAAMADYTCATTRNARKIIYPGVAHMPFWEVPEAFDRDVGDFLRTI